MRIFAIVASATGAPLPMFQLLVAAIQGDAQCSGDKPYYYEGDYDNKDDIPRCVSKEECVKIGYTYEEDGEKQCVIKDFCPGFILDTRCVSAETCAKEKRYAYS